MGGSAAVSVRADEYAWSGCLTTLSGRPAPTSGERRSWRARPGGKQRPQTPFPGLAQRSRGRGRRGLLDPAVEFEEAWSRTCPKAGRAHYEGSMVTENGGDGGGAVMLMMM